MATLDWSLCPAVESNPGKRSGAWVFKGTRMPVATVFENLQDMSVDELMEEFGVTREQVQAVLIRGAYHGSASPAARNATQIVLDCFIESVNFKEAIYSVQIDAAFKKHVKLVRSRAIAGIEDKPRLANLMCRDCLA